MVKLTTKYLLRKILKTNQVLRKRKDETDHEYLSRLTHLQLKSQFIDGIAPILECSSVSVVYLQNNLLQNFENLENFPNLTHLHLQHNYISKMENLRGLKLLRKLYLGYNEISVVEGLEGLEHLTELHLEGQRLPEGETLYFDPLTIAHLAKSLIELNIASNNITSIRSLSPLISLKKLNVDENMISDIEELTEPLKNLFNLEILSSQGNPVANDRKYFDHVVVASKSLKTLNGKDIDQHTRTFITNLTRNREIRKRSSKSSSSDFDPGKSSFVFSDDVLTASNLSPSPGIGSKLFPILKHLSVENRKNTASTSFDTRPPMLPDPCKVTRLINWASYFTKTFEQDNK